MELRQYQIHISKRRQDVHFPPDVLEDFGCCISEPSGFVLNNASSRRGLAYTDHNGNAIAHPYFIHIALMPDRAPHESEEDEIKEFVSTKIAVETQLNKYHDFEAQVTKLKTEIHN